jgi:hypothetical protein
MVMEMGSAKRLDEACNHYNEVYRDEALYAAWAKAPRVATVDDADPEPRKAPMMAIPWLVSSAIAPGLQTARRS